MNRPAEYVNHPGLAQSDLNLFEKNIYQFHKEVILGEKPEEKKSDALDKGSIADALILQPDALKSYYVMTQYKASGKEKEVVDAVFNLVSTKMKEKEPNMIKWPQLNDFEADIVKGCEQLAYQGNWKLETRVAKIIEKGKEYFDQLKEAGGRTIVSLDVWNETHALIDQIKEDESTHAIFVKLKGEHAEKKRYIVHKQEYIINIDPATGEQVKGLLDFWIEDTKLKEIDPWDLKTAKSHAQFLMNYRMSRYGRQGSFYSNLLSLKYKGYKINPFKFLVLPTQSGETPEVYTMSESELIANRDGAESALGFRVKGFRELITDIQWHRDNGKWDHRKEYYERGYNIIKGNLNVDPALLVDSEEVVF